MLKSIISEKKIFSKNKPAIYKSIMQNQSILSELKDNNNVITRKHIELILD